MIKAFLPSLLELYTYFKHDKKLKTQQKFINEHQVEKIRKEAEEQKRADVRASMTDRQGRSSFSGTLVVKNYGKATAYDVSMFRRPCRKGLFLDHIEMKELLPGEQQEYKYRWGFGDGGEIPVCITWSDESGENRQNKCTLRL